MEGKGMVSRLIVFNYIFIGSELLVVSHCGKNDESHMWCHDHFQQYALVFFCVERQQYWRDTRCVVLTPFQACSTSDLCVCYNKISNFISRNEKKVSQGMKISCYNMKKICGQSSRKQPPSLQRGSRKIM